MIQIFIIIFIAFLTIAVFLPIIFKQIKLRKQKLLIDEQNEKIEEMNKSETSKNKEYVDFTEGHLYK